MFRAKSWIQRSGVGIILLVSLLAGTVVVPHAEGPDDFTCSPILVNHDESAHYIGAAPSPADPEPQHCFLCHSPRSVFSVFDRYEQLENALRVERLHAAPASFAGRVTWALVPGRAPPA